MLNIGHRYKTAAFALITFMVLIIGQMLSAAQATERPYKINILDGGQEDGSYLAAIELKLAGGYLTYWRTPGEAGIAPSFNWSASENLETVSVEWPAPERVLEADSVVYGFHKQVIIPLRIKPKQTGKPVTLNLELQFGVCKDICIPSTDTISTSLTGKGDNAVVVQRAFRNLPVKQKLAEAGALSVLSVTRSDKENEYIARLRTPENQATELFAEGLDGWILSTSLERNGPEVGTSDFTIKVEYAPKAELTTKPFIRLTAKSGTQSIETEVQVE
ncbi:protein-disulfide reductase DsbD domain-containing protein [Microvirga sp. W0021]|uniref:Protein-disulfide reductase DsbD domain-containing protein n=1 Tax=Hohaiivirga grylli TaxID=3133970 RepID=A0ABV0BII4_9HYPH